MIKEKPPNTNEDEIFSFVEDILRYLENDKLEDYKINQKMIGIKDLFQGYIGKV